MKYSLNENWINDATITELPNGATLLSEDEWNNRYALPEGVTPPSPNYSQLRRKEYPSIQDQLDTLYHGGIDAWKAEIKTVKDKYPKSN
jgi:hypothetical protein